MDTPINRILAALVERAGGIVHLTEMELSASEGRYVRPLAVTDAAGRTTLRLELVQLEAKGTPRSAGTQLELAL